MIHGGPWRKAGRVCAPACSWLQRGGPRATDLTVCHAGARRTAEPHRCTRPAPYAPARACRWGVCGGSRRCSARRPPACGKSRAPAGEVWRRMRCRGVLGIRQSKAIRTGPRRAWAVAKEVTTLGLKLQSWPLMSAGEMCVGESGRDIHGGPQGNIRHSNSARSCRADKGKPRCSSRHAPG